MQVDYLEPVLDLQCISAYKQTDSPEVALTERALGVFIAQTIAADVNDRPQIICTTFSRTEPLSWTDLQTQTDPPSQTDPRVSD